MSKKWRDVDRQQVDLLPPTIDELLPERHLARFVVEIVGKLDFSAILARYEKRNRGPAVPYHPSLLVALLFYGYSTGVFSSRKIELATHESIPFRFIAAGLHPDHDTIANFRSQNLEALDGFFHDILLTAREMGLLKCGRISTDGSKIHANASKHSAASYARADEIEARLKAEIEELMKKAAEADSTPNDEGLDIPPELARRHDRIAKMEAAREAIKARAKEKAAQKHEENMAEYEKKLEAAREKAGQGGSTKLPPVPKPPDPEPDPKAQYNFTDPESRIMPVTGKGFEQCYNAQVSVDTDSRIVVGKHVTQAPNDKQELLSGLQAVSPQYGIPSGAIADAGFCSEEQLRLVREQFPDLDLHVAAGRTPHGRSLADLLAPEPEPAPDGASETEKMQIKLRTKAGKTIYALRKQTVEPVIGIIKSVLGFRQFLLRGFKKVQGEWGLVCIGYNLKRLYTLEGLRMA